MGGGNFAHYYFDRGKLTGVLASGRPDEERKPVSNLLRNELEIELEATLV